VRLSLIAFPAYQRAGPERRARYLRALASLARRCHFRMAATASAFPAALSIPRAHGRDGVAMPPISSHIVSMTMKELRAPHAQVLRDEFRRSRYFLGWAKRPKTLRCQWCKTKLKVAPRGRLPVFCCQTCRQRAYERRKWSRPHAVEALAKDIATARVRGAIRQEIWMALRELGLTTEPEPPPRSPGSRPALRLVKPPQ
jgi:hypothetical protein